MRYSCDNLLKKGHEKAQDIEAQRDYMDMVCRSYAARLEKRRNLLITSVRFHRLAEEVRNFVGPSDGGRGGGCGVLPYNALEGRGRVLSVDALEGRGRVLSVDALEGRGSVLSVDALEGRGRVLSVDALEDGS